MPLIIGVFMPLLSMFLIIDGFFSRSTKTIELNKWHDVLIQKVDRTGTLQIDNNNNWLYTGTSEVNLMSPFSTNNSNCQIWNS